MNRARADNRCPTCNEVPKDNGDCRLTCACGKIWYRQQGEKGTEEDELFLKAHGFEVDTDRDGDVYYIGPEGQLMWLYAGREWFCDAAPGECASLEDYFAWLGRERARR